MWLFLIFKMLTCVLHLSCRLFSVSEIMIGIKMERFLILGTKSSKKKKVGTKVGMGCKCKDENSIFTYNKNV